MAEADKLKTMWLLSRSLSLNRYSLCRPSLASYRINTEIPVQHAVQTAGAQLAFVCTEHSSSRCNTTSSAAATVQLGGASFKHEEQKTCLCPAVCWEWWLEWIPWAGWPWRAKQVSEDSFRVLECASPVQLHTTDYIAIGVCAALP